jgi:hypothetical protein
MSNGNGWNKTFPVYVNSELSSNIDPACLAQVIYLSSSRKFFIVSF